MPASIESALFQEELQRVLGSDSFRNSESLRRMLAYLADAYLAGTGRRLKEYAIGRDLMGKPEDYDPRTDASVRVQIGKLRQRLERYYATEAPASEHVLTLPKGHFELAFETAPARLPELPPVVEPPPSNPWKLAVYGLVVVVVILLGALWRTRPVPAVTIPMSGDFHEFWGPFIDAKKPSIVVLGSPLFVRFNSQYFRNPLANHWPEAAREIPLDDLGKLLKSPTPPTPTYRWTPFGEAAAAFRLAAMLGSSKDLVLKRSTSLSWEDVRASNLIFLGPAKFNRQIPDLPIEQDFLIERGAVTNLRPQAGELSRYQKPSPPDVEDIPEDYAVITRAKPSSGWGEVLVLASTSTEGTWAAAEFLTSTAQLKQMLTRLRSPNGALPDHYQLVIKSRFKSQVPIHTEYVTHHVLHTRH